MPANKKCLSNLSACRQTGDSGIDKKVNVRRGPVIDDSLPESFECVYSTETAFAGRTEHTDHNRILRLNGLHVWCWILRVNRGGGRSNGNIQDLHPEMEIRYYFTITISDGHLGHVENVVISSLSKLLIEKNIISIVLLSG